MCWLLLLPLILIAARCLLPVVVCQPLYIAIKTPIAPNPKNPRSLRQAVRPWFLASPLQMSSTWLLRPWA